MHWWALALFLALGSCISHRKAGAASEKLLSKDCASGNSMEEQRLKNLGLI